MQLRLARILLAGAIAFAAPLSAQPVHFRFTDPGAGYNAFGIYIGTYGGIEDYGQPDAKHVGLNCVDYFHDVLVGQEWDANISLLTGDISNTRHPNSLATYQQAAWMISQYSSTNVQTVQATLWNLFGNPGSNWPADQTLLEAARSPHPGFSYRDFYVVTDVSANGPQDANSVQEFIVHDPIFAGSFRNEVSPVTAPEPASLVLFGTGLLGLAGIRFRRRKS